MSLLDRILSVDKSSIKEYETEKIKSKMLQRFLGEDEPVEITVRSLPAKKVNRFIGKQFDKKGNLDFDKSLRAKANLAVEGIVDPSLKDSKLIAFLDVETPADAAEKLFGLELTNITDKICELSGMVTDEEEAEEEDDEIKNS
ncbi:MAG: hypothetical protein NC122_06310 [Faecalibacterium sp.]|nr:hypothetical protein [Ruminococcus sp.]MCM1392107.1 hypothetical protein [Ruminococcus sp.]MCM1485804.1 hypothetical protein [Faecalibacterium sp.]